MRGEKRHRAPAAGNARRLQRLRQLARLQPTEPAEDEEHYVPPPPPPLPKLALPTIWALIVLIASVAMLAFGNLLGLGGNVAFFIGVGGVLVGAGMLIMRLRESPPDDIDDDGAVI